MLENPKLFEIKCKKCGSTNIRIWGVTKAPGKFGCSFHGLVTIECVNCGEHETAEETDGCAEYHIGGKSDD